MKKLIFYLCSVAIATSPTCLLQPVFAENRATQEEWLEQYTPTRLEWLVVKLTSNDKPCVFSKGNVATYRWSQIKEDEVQLTVASNREDFGYCASLAFAELQIESSKVQLNPPLVKVRHFDRSTATDTVWTCSVPAKKDVDFERVCRK
jgi:hypothetical protein